MTAFLLRKLWIVNYYVESLSNNLGTYINDVRRFLWFFDPPSPPNPIMSYFSTCPYFMMSYFDPQTPPKTLYIQKYLYRRFPKLATFFQFLAEKLYVYVSATAKD